jgi:hypothetical protein
VLQAHISGYCIELFCCGFVHLIYAELVDLELRRKLDSFCIINLHIFLVSLINYEMFFSYKTYIACSQYLLLYRISKEICC